MCRKKVCASSFFQRPFSQKRRFWNSLFTLWSYVETQEKSSAFSQALCLRQRNSNEAVNCLDSYHEGGVFFICLSSHFSLLKIRWGLLWKKLCLDPNSTIKKYVCNHNPAGLVLNQTRRKRKHAIRRNTRKCHPVGSFVTYAVPSHLLEHECIVSHLLQTLYFDFSGLPYAVYRISAWFFVYISMLFRFWNRRSYWISLSIMAWAFFQEM